MSEVIGWIVQGKGLKTYTLTFPEGYWAKWIEAGTPFERCWRTSLPETIRLKGLWTFIGFDYSDITEADLEVYATNPEGDDCFPLVLRSPHRGNEPDPWRWYGQLEGTGGLRHLRIFVRGKVVGGYQARIHVGLKILARVDHS